MPVQSPLLVRGSMNTVIAGMVACSWVDVSLNMLVFGLCASHLVHACSFFLAITDTTDNRRHHRLPPAAGGVGGVGGAGAWCCLKETALERKLPSSLCFPSQSQSQELPNDAKSFATDNRAGISSKTTTILFYTCERVPREGQEAARGEIEASSEVPAIISGSVRFHQSLACGGRL